MNLSKSFHANRLSFGAIVLTLLLFASLASVLHLLARSGQLLPIHIVSYSLIFSILILTAWAINSNQLEKIKFLFKQENILIVGIMGILSPFSYFLAISSAFSELGKVGHVDEAYVLNATWPVLLVLFSFILNKDKPNIGNLSALLLGFIGIVVILTNGNFSRISLSNAKGDFLALLAAVTFGLYSALLGSKKLKDLFHIVGPVIAVLGFQIISLICSLILLLVTTTPVVPSLIEIVLLLFSGAGCFGIAYVSLYYARSHLPTTTVAVFMLVVPFISLLLLGLITHNPSIQSYWIGLSMIASGILAQTILSILPKKT